MVRGWNWPSALLLAAASATSAIAAPPVEPAQPAEPALPASAEPALPIEEIAARLSRRWAPVYIQHVDPDDRGADRPTRVDFDGNWDVTDNWDSQAEYGTALPPAAYAAAILTATHAFLTYTLYYPRDWSRVCVAFVCHDNDLETVQLVVERAARGGDGELVEVRTKAHHTITDTPGHEVARSADGHPMVKVESRGHGIATCKRDDPGCSPRTGRIVYAPGDAAGPPPDAATGQTVRYELLSLRDTLWARRGVEHRRLWTDGETGPLYYHGRDRGRLGNVMGAAMATTRYIGGVRPPWALAAARGKRGDWFLDPAGGRGLPATYVYNPFLDDLARECNGVACPPARPERTRLRYFAKLGAPYIALALGAVVVTGLIRSRGAAPRS